MMKKKTLTVFASLFWGCLFLSSFAFAGVGDATYQTLLQRLKGGDTTIDFLALRLAYAGTADYNPYGKDDHDMRSEMFRALKEKRYQEALGLAEKILEENYVDLDSHYICRMAHKGMNDAKREAFHGQVFVKLARSILSGGDGRTPETAGLVINTNEEYVILSLLGLKLKKQSLIHQNGHSYDRMDVVNEKTGETTSMYFNVDLPYKWLTERMKKK